MATETEVRDLNADEVKERRRQAGLPVDGEQRGRGNNGKEVRDLEDHEVRERRARAGRDPEPPEPRGRGRGVLRKGPASERPDHVDPSAGNRGRGPQGGRP